MKEPVMELNPILLIADDDEEDRLLIKDAFEESKFPAKIVFGEDGEEVINYLNNTGRFADKKKFPIPSIIILDLNMPKKDGRETLQEIKSNPNLRSIPIIILTTSNSEKDIALSYSLGANTYICKPSTYTSLIDIVKTLSNYWYSISKLPGLSHFSIA